MKTSLGEMILGRQPTAEERQRETHKERIAYALREFLHYPAEVLEDRGNGRYAAPGGILLVRRLDAILNSAGQLVCSRLPHGYFLDAYGDPVFLDRAGTVAEIEERQAAKQRAQVEAREKRQVEYAAMPRRAITLEDIEQRRIPTLAQAARTIIVGHCGTIENRDGELVIEVGEPLAKSPVVQEAARALFAGRAIVLAELAKKSPKPLAERLPDEALRGGGGAG